MFATPEENLLGGKHIFRGGKKEKDEAAYWVGQRLKTLKIRFCLDYKALGGGEGGAIHPRGGSSFDK